MQVTQEPFMDEESRERLIALFGEATAFDEKSILFPYAVDRQDLTPVRKVARESKRVTSASLHAPGGIVEMSDGRKYEVQDDGSWRRINPK